MATIEDLHKFVSDKWGEYCAADPIRRVTAYRIKVAFQEWEAEFFMRGLALGLFEVTSSDGWIHYQDLGGETGKRFFHPQGLGTGREVVTQFAAITQLIEEYNYPVRNILAESVKGGQSPRHALDALVFDGQRDDVGSVRIAIEAKSTAALARRLADQISSCLERGEHGSEVHRPSEKDAHKKYQALLEWRPAHLWVVCPTERRAYSIRQLSKTNLSLGPVDDIPKFTASDLPAKPKRFPPMLKRLGLGMLVTLLLMTVVKFIERTSVGHRIETLTFEALQGQKQSFDSEKELPIIVVNMSQIPGGNGQVTSRDELRKTIAAIAAQHPSAVGIDVDFSPGLNGWQADDDPEFFDFCLKLKHDSKVPIFLGVYRTIGERADTWLGSDKYKELAAALRVDEDRKRLPRWLQAKGSGEKLPMMSAALATAYQPFLPEVAGKLARTIEVTSDNTHGIEYQGEDQMLLGVSLVNYSKLEEIQRETILTIKPEAIADSEKLFAGRMVILGDSTEFQDSFIVPGRKDPIAGVYLIACSAYTLAVEPLYEFNAGARLALDLFISILIMLRVEQVRPRYGHKTESSEFDRAQSRSIWIAIGAVTISGFLMTRWLNIMWFDFPLIGFALLLHPKVEHRLSSVWNMLRAKKATAK
jgi:hypothetical protein